MKLRYIQLLRYALAEWHTLGVIVALTLGTSAISVFQPWPLKILVDYGLKASALPPYLEFFFASASIAPSTSTIIILAALGLIGQTLIASIAETSLSYAWAKAGQQMVFRLTVDLFYRLQRLSLLYHRTRSLGDSLSRLSVDTWSIYSVTSSLMISPINQVFLLLMVGGVAYQLDPQLALMAIALAPVLGLTSIFWGRQLKTRAQEARKAQSRVTSFVHQTLRAVPIVQCSMMETPNRAYYKSLTDEVVRWSQRGALLNSIFGSSSGLITAAGMAVILYAGSSRVLQGELSVGSLLIFLTYIRTLQQASQSLLQTFGALKPAEASIDRVLEILDAEEQVSSLPGAHSLPLEEKQVTVQFENVTFGYQPDRPVLQGITLTAKPGETIALVGATGAGKTTLVSLLPRFFDPWSGRITMNGVDICTATLESVRDQVALVLQEPFLLPLTIAENIAYEKPGAHLTEIVAAAEAANADEFIRALPDGYHTIIGERGATLSGGQRQRIAIARALLKDAPLLILDEPTSALDVRTEALVIEALERLMKGRTTFIIAHRLSTVRRANRILVLAEGRIVESGTHEELLAARGVYARNYQLQFGLGQERAG